MGTMQVGDRVMCISHEDAQAIHVYGSGVYEGEHPIGAEARGPLASMLRAQGGSNPRIKLDNGQTIWGCECWFGPIAEVAERLGGAQAAGKRICTGHDIDQVRVLYEGRHRRESFLNEMTMVAAKAWERDVAQAMDAISAALHGRPEHTVSVELVSAFLRTALSDGDADSGMRDLIRPYAERYLDQHASELAALGLDRETVLSGRALDGTLHEDLAVDTSGSPLVS